MFNEENESGSDQQEFNIDDSNKKENIFIIESEDSEEQNNSEIQSISEESQSKQKVPDSILRYLRPEFNFDLIDDYTQSKLEKENLSKSIFQKVVKTSKNKKLAAGSSTSLVCTSQNLNEEKIKKSLEIFDKHYAFKNVNIDQKQIKPLNSVKLDLKQRRKERLLTTGEKWGSMARVELTEEVKADLRALQYRDQIFSKRFYKSNDSKKLPEYFQIGTVVDDSRIQGNQGKYKNKNKNGYNLGGNIARQFLQDDKDQGFSKRKYENINQKLRRMGEKKQKFKINKSKIQLKNKKISKKK